MRRSIHFAIAIAFVLFATPTLAGVRVTEPRPYPHEALGTDVEAHAAFSMPTGEPDAIDCGHDFGLRITFRQSRHVGTGFDIDQQHWVSPEAGRELDRFFSAFAPMTGTRASADVLQFGVHVRVFPWAGADAAPWLQVGGGVAMVTSVVTFPWHRTTAPGFTVTLNDLHSRSDQPEFHAAGGFDLAVAQHVRVGPDATWRWIYYAQGPSFTAFSAGLHVRFVTP